MLPDVLAPNLRAVFCGTAASKVSADRKSYYANKQNRFWSILHATQLVPTLLRTEEFHLLLLHRLGLTDLVKSHAGMDHQIPLSQLREEAKERLEREVRKYKPQYLAFTSKRAGQEFLGRKRQFGEQPETIQETKIWILPSTSSAAKRSWKPEVWQAFARAVRGEA
jgi:TDG/mug DNA glycosylase family protein